MLTEKNWRQSEGGKLILVSLRQLAMLRHQGSYDDILDEAQLLADNLAWVADRKEGYERVNQERETA